MDEILDKASRIKLAVFDVDGVMTDGGLIFGSDGSEYKTFHVHDGLGLVMLKEAGIQVAIISARTSSIVTERMSQLGIDHVLQGQGNKKDSIKRLIQECAIEAEATAYTGDDLIDLPAMSVAGLSIAVANAHPQVKDRADWVTSKAGGQGAVREICEFILKAKGRFDEASQHYFVTDSKMT